MCVCVTARDIGHSSSVLAQHSNQRLLERSDYEAVQGERAGLKQSVRRGKQAGDGGEERLGTHPRSCPPPTVVPALSGAPSLPI